MNALSSHRAAPRAGFTLVEIMITMVIIGLLMALALPSFIQLRDRSKASIVSNNFRVYRDTFNAYAMENNGWPEPAAVGVVPPEMVGAVKGFDDPSIIGGQWQWINDGTYCAVALIAPPDPDDIILRVDETIDDGALDAGLFQKIGSDYYLILQEY